METESLKEAAFGRRIALKSALGAVAAASLAGASPQAAVASTHAETKRTAGKIDVHAHYLPPDYRQALIDNGHSQ
ncbi:hypothetical protein, partial [Arthrobacter sp. HMWF013]|uniref:hypothetical protein n=1 Tax=Arthrobacter sp. HMWF013 TaxID=2056849 RepID=UPI003F8CFAF3